MAWRRNLQVSSVGTSAERLGVGADHDGGRAAGAKGAATEETRKGLRLRILPGTGCHRAGPPSKSGARAGGGRSDDFTQSNCGGTEAELATSATTCLHPQPPSRAYICVRNLPTVPACESATSTGARAGLVLLHTFVVKWGIHLTQVTPISCGLGSRDFGVPIGNDRAIRRWVDGHSLLHQPVEELAAAA